jgi:hypothetical protein
LRSNLLVLAALPKCGWLDPERAQIDVGLPAVMNLVIDSVENRADSALLPLAECFIDLSEAMRRNLRPDFVQRLRSFLWLS